MSTNLYIENEVVSVKNSKQIRSKYPLNLVGTGANGNITLTGTISGAQLPSVNVAGSNVTLTAAQAGSLVTLNPSAAVTITLPTPVTGMQFSFVFATAATGTNTVKVITAVTASQFMQGWLGVPVAAGTQKLFFGDGSSDVSLNFNATTTGGLLGGAFTITALSTTIWQVQGNVEGSGTVATPFGTS